MDTPITSPNSSEKRVSLADVKELIRKELPWKYWLGVWSRSTDAGIEVGVNNRNTEGSRASLLPIDNESRPRFAKFLASEVLKHDVPRSTANETSPSNTKGDPDSKRDE